jgi:hypothetical protein
MSSGRVIRCALVGLFSLILAGIAWSQNDGAKYSVGSQGDQSSPARSNAAELTSSHRGGAGKSEAGKKPALARLTRVSTEEAAHGAAADAAKKNQKVAPQPDGSKTQDSAVLEFRPVDPDRATAGAVTAPPGNNKSALKNMHGGVYGSNAPGNRGTYEAAGSVGTTSKSGKTSVYIETDRSRASPPR